MYIHILFYIYIHIHTCNSPPPPSPPIPQIVRVVDEHTHNACLPVTIFLSIPPRPPSSCVL